MQYIIKLLTAVVARLKALTLNPVRNFLRKLQMMVNINVIANKIVTPITQKFRDVFHIKPKSEKDYYSVFGLLVAKKLVTAMIVVCCIAVFAYFAFIAEPIEQQVTTTTGITSNVYFDYDDIDLSEYTGRANIKAANGKVVYIGDIKNGVCEGKGILFNQSGVLVYEGDFLNNVYHGQGKGYAQDGSLLYDGDFVDNVYEGNGILYYPSGQIQYQGGFAGGFYSGSGFLYAQTGELIYEGTFQNGLYHGDGTLYYEDGDRQYEGEFVMGVPQGSGTLFTNAGRPYYTGIIADGDIAYESLISLSLKDLDELFYEDPIVYYTSESTCYVYECAQLVLELDCIVRIVTNELQDNQTTTTSNEGDGWYLPEGVGDAVVLDTSQATESKKDEKDEKDETDDTEAEQDVEQKTDVDLPTDFITEKQKVFYYVNNAEWIAESDLDKGSIKVDGVTVYKEELKNPFNNDVDYVAVNGVTGLSDCIAISKIRRKTPTAFSNITFEEVSKNYHYNYVKNINYAQAIYEELIDTDDFSYQLCYQIDDASKLYYYKISAAKS